MSDSDSSSSSSSSSDRLDALSHRLTSFENGSCWDATYSLEDTRSHVASFARNRDWNQYHTPRNLILALMGEVGELAEIFQWRGEVSPGVPEFSDSERLHLSEELADVMLYTVRLADRCGIDLPTAIERKLMMNEAKYPADQCYGKANKYTDYIEGYSDSKSDYVEFE